MTIIGNHIKSLCKILCVLSVGFISFQCTQSNSSALKIEKGSHIILIGNNLGSRMMDFDHFETGLHMRFPDSLLYIRNMCDGGNTPGFRPHSGRPSPWAFPGAEKFYAELAHNSDSQGEYETPDQWITRHKGDIIIAFFGFNESFQGEAGLENYKAELDTFIRHTLNQNTMGVQRRNSPLCPPSHSKIFPVSTIYQTAGRKI
jgi:hypothetical protein